MSIDDPGGCEYVSTFSREGWVKVPGLLSEQDLDQVREAAAELSSEQWFEAHAGEEIASPAFQAVLRVHSGLRGRFPILTEIAHGIGPFAARLLGVADVRLWSDNLFVKPGQDGAGRATFWHQDSPKLPIDRRGVINAWIAVDDVPVSSGALTFLGGSHRVGSLGSISQLEEERDLSELLAGPDWELITHPTTVALRAGDATFHHGMILHRAGPNLGPADRVGLAIHMVDAAALYTGAPSRHTDGLGLRAFGPLEGHRFPVLGERL